jgi:hypothetical protein
MQLKKVPDSDLITDGGYQKMFILKSSFRNIQEKYKHEGNYPNQPNKQMQLYFKCKKLFWFIKNARLKKSTETFFFLPKIDD